MIISKVLKLDSEMEPNGRPLRTETRNEMQVKVSFGERDLHLFFYVKNSHPVFSFLPALVFQFSQCTVVSNFLLG